MSYIRSGSNPENLYIVGTGENVEIIRGKLKIKTMPVDLFNTLLKNSHDIISDLGSFDFDDGILIDGASIKYERFKIRLSYENWHVDMFYSTFYFLVMKNKFRWEK